VSISLPGAPITAHMAVFPPFTYKKAHRHGPGVVIVIPAGEGFSIMWAEGKEKVMIPWHEASVFVPPNRWFHQHFNVGDAPARYLAMHALPGLSTYSERVEDLARDQIEYPDEDPFIRQTFEAELAKRGLTSRMPAGAYADRNYKWTAD
jgi:gentisate 1,2-dioxygenase